MTAAQFALLMKILGIMAFVMDQWPDVKQRYVGLLDKLRQMNEEDRDPTPEEWDEINGETEEIHSLIQSLPGSEEPEPT